MAIGKTDSKYYEEIADFIREVSGTSRTYSPPQMEPALRAAFENYIPEDEDPAYPAFDLPGEYEYYVDEALKIYRGDYTDILVADWDGTNIVVGFLLDNFEILSYNVETTEYSAKGWHSVWCIPETDEWGYNDMTTTPGVSYAKNLKFASRKIVSDDLVLWPQGRHSQEYATGTPVNFTLSASGWNGTTYTLDLSAYTNLANIQIGTPLTSSMYNALLIRRCALTIPRYSGTTAYISAVTAPTVDIDIALWGLT